MGGKLSKGSSRRSSSEEGTSSAGKAPPLDSSLAVSVSKSSREHSESSSLVDGENLYTKWLQQLSDILTDHVDIDSCKVIISFVPTITMLGERGVGSAMKERRKLNISVRSTHLAAARRFGTLWRDHCSPLCMCGSVMDELGVDEDDAVDDDDVKCDECDRTSSARMLRCTGVGVSSHKDGFILCDVCQEAALKEARQVCGKWDASPVKKSDLDWTYLREEAFSGGTLKATFTRRIESQLTGQLIRVNVVVPNRYTPDCTHVALLLPLPPVHGTEVTEGVDKRKCLRDFVDDSLKKVYRESKMQTLFVVDARGEDKLSHEEAAEVRDVLDEWHEETNGVVCKQLLTCSILDEDNIQGVVEAMVYNIVGSSDLENYFGEFGS